MKRMRLLSCMLAAAMVLSLMGPVLAASYPDLKGSEWAETYINDMTEKGIFTGIKEGNQTLFKPAKTMTAVEAIALCARISVDTATRRQIGQDRAEQITALTGDASYWARDEFATCIEAGILSYAELKELWQSGDMTRTISKEDFALYLVRAMQLAPMAENLSTYKLEFKDADSIRSGLEPYVYVLSTYGIITGDDNGNFAPKSSVRRDVAATMLSRAIDFMEESGTSVELPEYTDYAWEAGMITEVEPNGKDVIRLTLKSDISGEKKINIPTATPIYENSMLARTSLLKSGIYARVCFDGEGKPLAVRLSGGVETVSGTVVGVSEDTILLSVDGVTRSISYDRFTEVQVGRTAGERDLIDVDAGYSNAVCSIDQLGHLVAVQLTGGSHEESGLIAGVERLAGGDSNVILAGMDGQRRQFRVQNVAEITANSFAVTEFDARYVGAYATLRVSNDDQISNSVVMDTVTQYVQGAVRSVGSGDGKENITVTDLTTNRATTYTLLEDAKISYNNAAAKLADVQRESYVTLRLSGGEVAELYAYPGSNRTDGTLTGISYPTGTTRQILTVATAQGTVVPFEVDLKDPPQVRYNGRSSSLSALRTGDNVTVTVRYNAVTLIDALPKSADVAGTVVSKSESLDGVTIEVELDNGSGKVTYALSKSISVTRENKLVQLSELQVGCHVAMITSSGEVLSIEIDKAASVSTTQLTGTVILADARAKTITFRTGEENVITVSVPTGTTIQQLGSGTISLSRLETGDELDIYGKYENGTFVATLVVKK